MSNLHVSWRCAAFSELSNKELYKILSLRNAVFVVEQNCAYQDVDGKDPDCFHFTGWINDEPVAYSRILPPQTAGFPEASIGRVIVSPAYRMQNLGRSLMERSIYKVNELFGPAGIIKSAQYYLKQFYESFSFVQISDVYLEDNIPHVSMKRNHDVNVMQ